jgi:hypothetical protein
MTISIDFIMGTMLGFEFFPASTEFATGGGMIIDLGIVRIIMEKSF